MTLFPKQLSVVVGVITKGMVMLLMITLAFSTTAKEKKRPVVRQKKISQS